MHPTSIESPASTWIDIPMAGLRSIQRGLGLGLAILAGLPGWLTPPAAALLVGWLAWRGSGSRAVAFQGGVDGCLGALFGLGLGQALLPLAGWAAVPLGMALGAGSAGIFFSLLEVATSRTSSPQAPANADRHSGPFDP